jgi:hypothetical protein
MEPITNRPPQMLILPTTLHLLDDEGPGVSVPAELRYDSADPYAIQLAFGSPEHPNAWILGRELLAAGLVEPAGDGDIHVWPGVGEDGQSILYFELTSDEEETILGACPADVRNFLAMSWKIVAAGNETEHCDIDAFLAAVLAGIPNGTCDD